MSVVVGYLATPEGRAALEAAIREAKVHGSKVVVGVSEKGRTLTDEERATREADLDAVRARLVEEGLAHEIRVTNRTKDAADDLIELAADVDATLIVIGLRRRTAVGKLILGSNAQRILLDAPCEVLAVKADAS